MSSYVDNHLRIWGKDAKAFMKAAAGEEMGEYWEYVKLSEVRSNHERLEVLSAEFHDDVSLSQVKFLFGVSG